MDEIRHLNYVVQRNWDGPSSEHPDLDLFVSNEDLPELRRILPTADIRTPGDNYYPAEIEELLLIDRREYNGWWIPSPKAAFLALYWHANLHKERHFYDFILEDLFFEWFPPKKANDPGVGFYGPGLHK